MYDIVIIGAGVVGTAVARELSKYQLRITVLEKNNEIACGATKANSGIVYNGHTARPDKLKGRLTLQGRQMFEALCRELDVAFKPIDMLIVGFDDEDGYAHDEILCPSRIVTTTVPIEGGVCKRLPVRSSEPLPKEWIGEWMRLVKELRVKAPVRVGEILIVGILGTGTDVISSKGVAQDQ
ncbi:DUF1667 domain-containing protein [Paenibacillus rhizophilus]|uniref:FAD-dependent oxidoreductase n=1 Tax=Paenibacillus rhizophilus TaxID=1850366 RepID=A0A3N9P400_9BACL|nr:DUF1667 domain-containing protein [Paenibacillus rhizophilus]RQW10515.1 FAD-dependent oxidoreductase [Paenibacillus rhizophilus]